MLSDFLRYKDLYVTCFSCPHILELCDDLMIYLKLCSLKLNNNKNDSGTKLIIITVINNMYDLSE